jgi:malonyl-CoA O-methyltransferase
VALHCEYLPVMGGADNAPDLVLLHGWGMSSIVWDGWLPLLRQHCNVVLLDLPGYGRSDPLLDLTLDNLLSSLLECLPTKAIYLGYSLGGMVAANIAQRFPERVTALITLATNARFVAADDWPCAMTVDNFAAFYEQVEQNPALALKKFIGLQLHSSTAEKQQIKKLREKLEVVPAEVLTGTLQLLASIDNRWLLNNLPVPCLQLFGNEDALVPAVAAEKIQALSDSCVEIITGAPHLLFVTHPRQCWQKIREFLNRCSVLTSPEQEPRSLDKKQVARSFGRAATTYDSAAKLQRQVGNILLDRLTIASAQCVLDLGCGTGFFSTQLQQRLPSSRIVGLDLAEGMVQFAAQKNVGIDWLCGDAENLPLANDSVDCIFSSLAIQWCEDYHALFAEIKRVLKPGGECVFATLGPETLHELRKAWQQVDDDRHVNRFAEQELLAAAISRAGLFVSAERPVFFEQSITLEYDTLKNLTQELKALGAHNINAGRPVGLTGKQRLKKFAAAYEQQRNQHQRLPASYQVWYGRVEKPISD